MPNHQRVPMYLNKNMLLLQKAYKEKWKGLTKSLS